MAASSPVDNEGFPLLIPLFYIYCIGVLALVQKYQVTTILCNQLQTQPAPWKLAKHQKEGQEERSSQQSRKQAPSTAKWRTNAQI
jgi:hypothetical protein